jgi:hypothetical protein
MPRIASSIASRLGALLVAIGGPNDRPVSSGEPTVTMRHQAARTVSKLHGRRRARGYVLGASSRTPVERGSPRYATTYDSAR